MTVVMSEEGTAPLPALPDGRRSWRSRRAGTFPYVLLVPTLIAIGVGLGYPLVRLVIMSTQEYGRRQQFGAPAPYVGTDNYSEIFGSPSFWDVLTRSLLFCVVNVALTIVLGTLLALLLARLGTVMRTGLSVALLLAWSTPALTATIVWQWIFDARYGVVNWLFTRLGADGYEGHSWLSEPLSFFFVATLIVVWMGVPFVAFTLYAGMTQISTEVMEAAAIDGAGGWQRFRDVTWPALKPIFVVLAALSTLWDLRVFTQIFVLQESGGLVRETNTLGVYAFRLSGSSSGVAAAVAVVMVGITLLLTLVYLRQMFRQEEV